MKNPDRCQSYAMSHQCVLTHGHDGVHDFLDLGVAIAKLKMVAEEIGTTVGQCRIYRFDVGNDPMLVAEICGGETRWGLMIYSTAYGWKHHSGRIKAA